MKDIPEYKLELGTNSGGNNWKVVPIYKKTISNANRKLGWKYYAYIAFAMLTNIMITVTLIIIINF